MFVIKRTYLLRQQILQFERQLLFFQFPDLQLFKISRIKFFFKLIFKLLSHKRILKTELIKQNIFFENALYPFI